MLDRSIGAAAEAPASTPIVGVDGGGDSGLTSEEAARRHQAGQGNVVEQRTTRSVTDIVRANTLTRFNAIIVSLTLVVFIFGDPIDAVFGLVTVVNSVIGVVQELRAKRSLDALRVLIIPSIAVVRDRRIERLAPSDLVLGDVIQVKTGDQVPVDGRVVQSDGLEVDESSLTGESDPIPKPTDAEILSGSVVVAGGATAVAVRVGADSWAARLTTEAKDFVLTQSELRVGIDRLLRVVGWLLPPLSALLVWSQLRTDASLADGLVSAVAGVVALVPQGLVLLVSMSFAIAVIRLGRRQVIVQELPAVEGLARVDVLCVDKTGTLTTGRLTIDRIDALGVDAPGVDALGVDAPGIDSTTLRSGLATLAGLEGARSATTEALLERLRDENAGWEVAESVPFSSVRKWSGAAFPGRGSWVLGAPEILLDAMADAVPDRQEHDVHGGHEHTDVDGPDDLIGRVREQVNALAADARRVLLVARSEEPFGGAESLPPGLRPVGLVALKEEIRPDAAETMAYFARQGVQVKVVSGDNPRTVAAVAAELGIPGAENSVDLRAHRSVADVPAETTIFGRVLPEQKRELVHLLQARGHTVAMTGDGVNDIPSLKAADIGIAMNTATPATKAIAQLVLLDGRFDRLPGVVGEGRRVIANMERISSLFVTKTVYAAVLAVVVGVAGVTFPFLPRHLSLIGAITIGLPGFALSFLPSTEPCRPGYLRRVLRFSVPAGLVTAATTFAAYWAMRFPAEVDLDQARTAATMVMMITGLWILSLLVRPFDTFTSSLLIGLVVATAVALVPSPLSSFYALRLPPTAPLLGLLAALATGIGVAEAALMLRGRENRGRRIAIGPSGRVTQT